ncbi:diacylglycerol lipase-alpha isoform X2 [Acinonyx jubatus]|uniref:sn-1-specific diacylglycerol lipase n=1 Tax=Acinonyx jubatus TaxID=32536 RepID=A0ABM3NI10_ACIJB|nr:diacylglycerol lipase-alpha isoform X2 [Acinonyx jubatus]
MRKRRPRELAILVIEFIYAIVGIVWLTQYYTSCNDLTAKNVTLGMVVCNWVVILSVCITVLCVFDPTGRTFVKLRATKRRQRNLRTYNLRHRLEEGQATSWSRRLKVFLCCTRTKDSQSDAYSEIAYLFAEFFRDLDIVPSDIIAGLVLLRQRQRAKRNAVLDEANNDILAFLSGMPVTRNTKYLDLKNSQEMLRYKEVCYYMLFALAAYGWPMYLMRKPACGLCQLARSCSCCLCPARPRFAPGVTIEEDNCCGCNAIAIRRHFLDENMTAVDIVYTSCHDAVYETPFYVAVDHDKKKVVISIRGTLSPKDALTDLTGDAERLPVEGHHGTWLGHKGMVLSAEYIKKKLEQEMVLSQAFGRDLGRGTKHYGLIVVGHSLGAGTAAILSFLLRPQYPTLKCFAYSPPGGLLSEDAMEYSKEFVTAVVLGKDLVPRRVASHKLCPLSTVPIPVDCSSLPGGFPSPRGESQSPQSRRMGGPTLPDLPSLARPCRAADSRLPVYPSHPVILMAWSFCFCGCHVPARSAPTPHASPGPWPGQADTCLASFPRIGLSQLEGFRRQLLDVLQRSTKPKWRIIVGATKCIPKSELPEEVEVATLASTRLWTHPSDLTIALSASTPLYPPGRIIHVVHNHPAEQCCCCEQEEPTYFAIWGDNKAFNEVIISPAMLHEHLPYVVMEGLNKVLENYNKGKTALLSAAKVMVSPTEVDLTPELIFQQQPLPTGPPVPAGLALELPTADHRNSSVRSKSQSEVSLEGFSEGRLLSPVAAAAAARQDPVELLLLSTQERLAAELQARRAPLATMESLSDTESLYSFDSRRSSGFRSIRGSPSLHAVLERDEGHLFYIDPAIPEENPSLSSRTELLAADSLSKHSQDTQPLEAALGSGGVTPERPPSAAANEEEEGGDGGGVAPGAELALHNGRLGDSPSPQVLEFAEFIDSLFNLDSKSSSFQDLYCMVVPESPTSDYAEGPKSPSQQEILLRAQFEPNLVPKPPRLFAGSADPSSGISLSPSFPLSSSGEPMDLSPTGLSSQECLAVDKIRTSTPTGRGASPAKQDDLVISAR